LSIRIQLKVVKGPDEGKTFSFSEPDIFLVGRDAPGCQAHFRLSPKDRYVSRNHFLLEIRPPYCYIRDNQSTNGTYIKRKGDREFKRIDQAELHDGDLIQVGYTVLEVRIIKEEQLASSEEKVFCIRCGREITELLRSKRTEELTISDYICPECKRKREAKRRLAPKKIYLCAICKEDVTSKADKDGRADELSDVALYLCERCANLEQREVDIREIRDYRILKVLGKGGMGIVYKAWHKPTGRLVAIKKILPKVVMDEKANKLFQREMAVMSNLIHRNIVRLFDQGMVGRMHYFVSEFMPDGSADDLINNVYRGPLPIELACDIVCQALDGLEYAHRKGFIHRDIKPSNILLRKVDGRFIAKLGDFGLAKNYERAGYSGMTRPGETAGTLLFMAPDQIVDYRFVKPPADVYSMGVSLYYLLTAKFPFNFPSPAELLMGLVEGKGVKDPILIILEDPRIPIRKKNPRIPKKLAKVVDKSIKRDKSKRYQSAAEFKEAILSAI